jgi:type II secretion system protein N
MLRAALTWIWQKKLHFFLGFVSALIVAFLVFPYDDLSDLVSAQVSAQTRNTVYVQFERLKLSLFPQAGAQLEQVFVESLFLPAGIHAQEITVTPALRALISQKPYGHVTAKGLFKGDVDIRLGSGGTSERGNEMKRLDITAERMQLQELRQLARLPGLIRGRLDLSASGILDSSFAEQPDMEVNIKIAQLDVPPLNIAIPQFGGDITLPELKISAVELKGRLANGRFMIENIKLGGANGDDLQGSVKGSLGMNLRNVGGAPSPEFSNYTFDIDLQASPSFQERARLYLSFIEPYKEANRYRFKVSGANFGGNPSFNKLR